VRIGIIGSGRIGGTLGKRLAGAGHEVLFSYSRDPARLERLAEEAGPRASAGTPAEAAAAPVVVLAVPWAAVDDALEQAGSLEGRVVVDTTNQYGPDGWVELPGGRTAAEHNMARMPGARYTKTFNTLPAPLQEASAGRAGCDRVVQWICGDDGVAKTATARLVDAAGYTPVDLGPTRAAAVLEAPRRPGSVFGAEWHLADARRVVAAVKAGRPVPPPPAYSRV